MHEGDLVEVTLVNRDVRRRRLDPLARRRPAERRGRRLRRDAGPVSAGRLVRLPLPRDRRRDVLVPLAPALGGPGRARSLRRARRTTGASAGAATSSPSRIRSTAWRCSARTTASRAEARSRHARPAAPRQLERRDETLRPRRDKLPRRRDRRDRKARRRPAATRDARGPRRRTQRPRVHDASEHRCASPCAARTSGSCWIQVAVRPRGAIRRRVRSRRDTARPRPPFRPRFDRRFDVNIGRQARLLRRRLSASTGSGRSTARPFQDADVHGPRRARPSSSASRTTRTRRTRCTCTATTCSCSRATGAGAPWWSDTLEVGIRGALRRRGLRQEPRCVDVPLSHPAARRAWPCHARRATKVSRRRSGWGSRRATSPNAKDTR